MAGRESSFSWGFGVTCGVVCALVFAFFAINILVCGGCAGCTGLVMTPAIESARRAAEKAAAEEEAETNRRATETDQADRPSVRELVQTFRDSEDPQPLVPREPTTTESTVKPLEKEGPQAPAVDDERQREAERLELLKQAAAQEGFRTWKSASGSFQLEARQLEFVGGVARLEERDGTTVDVTPGKLSIADRDYIRDELQRRREGNVPNWLRVRDDVRER